MALQIIILINFFIIGITLGSFYTLATYRIPLKQDITHTRSYCPNCNHRLKFWDLIPVFSFLFLKGRCRYCHEKISKRYIIIEVISGIIYVLLIMALKINFFNITIKNIITLLYVTLTYSAIFIIIGIATKTKKIQKSVLVFGIIVQVLYITYLCIV